MAPHGDPQAQLLPENPTHPAIRLPGIEQEVTSMYRWERGKEDGQERFQPEA